MPKPQKEFERNEGDGMEAFNPPHPTLNPADMVHSIWVLGRVFQTH